MEIALNLTGRATRIVLPADEPGPEAWRQASVIYGVLRDLSDEGASTFPEGRICVSGRPIARVSYNGRVWPPEPWKSEQKPLWPAE